MIEDGAVSSPDNITVSDCGFNACIYPVLILGGAGGTRVIDTSCTGFDSFNGGVVANAVTVETTGDVLLSGIRVWGTTGMGINAIQAGELKITDCNIRGYGALSSSALNSWGIYAGNEVQDLQCSGNSIDGKFVEFNNGIETHGDETQIFSNKIKNMGVSGSNYGLIIGADATNVSYGDNRFVDTLGIQDLSADINKSVSRNTGLQPAIVPSSSIVTLAPYSDFIEITGVAQVDTITASWADRVVTLKFNSALTVADGNNLKLKEAFTTSENSTLSMACDGTNWYEISRSAN